MGEDSETSDQLRTGTESEQEDERASFLDHPVVGLGARGDDRLGKRVGPYQLIRKIGQGGMGAVYQAVRADDAFEKLVAVKILKRGMDTDQVVKRFQTERQILANLEHANISRLIDGGTTDDNLPFLVMEYVEGMPIHEFCDKWKLSTDDRLRLIRKVCQTVHFAHQNLIVHRDLKPSNILVTPEGEPKLLDFGIAKVLEPENVHAAPLTEKGSRLMTPEYASPEQMLGKSITTASDIYALGLLAYELLTGRRPYCFQNRTSEEFRRTLNELPEKPSAAIFREEKVRTSNGIALSPKIISASRDGNPRKLRRSLTGNVDNIVLMALQGEPSRRYASARQFAEDIDRHLDGFPVIARKEPWLPLVKLFHRHLLAAITILIGFLLLIAFVVAMGVQQRKVTRERDRAQRVTELMVKLFEISDPYRLDKANITAQELLEKASREIERTLPRAPLVRADLMVAMGRVYVNLEQYQQARPLLEGALNIRLHAHGEWREDTAASLYYLAELLRRQGDYPSAEAYFNRALRIREKVYGSNHPKIAEALCGLASTNRLRGDYHEAHSLFRKAVTILEKASGETFLLAESLNNLALVDYKLGNYHEAERHHLQAKTFIARSAGSDHPVYATTLDNLGIVYRQVGRFNEAETLFRQALEIRRDNLGAESLDVAASYNNLALLYLEQDKYPEAEPLLFEVLRLREQKLGPEQKDVAQSYNNLGKFYMHLEKPDQAEPLHQRALSIRERLFGENSIVAISMNNLANVYYDQKKYDEAAILYDRALEIFSKEFAPDHPYASYPSYGLARVYLLRGELQKAEMHCTWALCIREQNMGSEHPQVAHALDLYVSILKEMKRYREAEGNEKRAQAIRSKQTARD